MGDAVDDALTAVPEKFYVLEPDGRPLPQSSNPQIISAVLRLCDLRADARILEIGTGSGFSTALLSHLVGPAGTVVSIEVISAVADRARGLLSKQDVKNAMVLAADGQRGCSAYAPFDYIVAWATAERIPQAWVAQLQPGGVIVAPVVLGPLAHATAVVRLRRHGEHSVRGESVIAGSFVPLSETPLQEFGKAPADADVIVEPDADPVTWLSGLWLREAVSQSDKARLWELCLGIDEAAGMALLAPGESAEAFRAYLLAVFPEGLTTAYLRSTGRAIGYSTREGAAFVSLRDGRLYASEHEGAAEILTGWVAEWRWQGCPGFNALEPIAEQREDGWSVRVKFRVSVQ